jgi:hypothetical protein
VVVPVHVFHEPVDVEEVVSEVEPCIENKHVDEDLLGEFDQSEFFLPSFPIPVEGSVRIDLPEPNGGIEQQAEK